VRHNVHIRHCRTFSVSVSPTAILGRAPAPRCTLRILRPPKPTLFPYTTLFRSVYPMIPITAGLIASTARARDSEPSRLRVASLRSEEHTSELQSREKLVCRLLLEKKKHAVAQSTRADTRVDAAGQRGLLLDPAA